MQKRKLGREGLEVSCIGLGCMGMSHAYGSPAERVDEESVRVIHRALDLGVTFFDTAEIYGPFTNEILLGRALAGRRDGVIIATKFGFDIQGSFPYAVCSRPAKIREVCDASLKRLGIDHIDLLYQHRVDPNVPIEEVVGTVGDLIDSGKVRFIGLSEAGPDTIRRAHRERKVSVLQSEYSLWERGIEERILPTIRELGIGLVPFSPLGRGFLAGGIRSLDELPPGDDRRTGPHSQGENLSRNLRIVGAVGDVARGTAQLLAGGDSLDPAAGRRCGADPGNQAGALPLRRILRSGFPGAFERRSRNTQFAVAGNLRRAIFCKNDGAGGKVGKRKASGLTKGNLQNLKPEIVFFP